MADEPVQGSEEEQSEAATPTEQKETAETAAAADASAESASAEHSEETTEPEKPLEAAAEEPASEPAQEAAAADEPSDTEPGETESQQLDIGSEAEPRVELDVPIPPPTVRGTIDERGVAIGTGRRKTAVARVRVTDGHGELSINGRGLEDYFTRERDRQMVLAPLRATGADRSVNVWVRVQGGGSTGQTGAVVLGIARALQAKNPDLHHTLSEGGFLTRDGRMVERKKYGLRKARRSFQFSKR